MIDLLLILLIIPLLGCLFVLFAQKNSANAFYVVLFTISGNIMGVLALLPHIIKSSDDTIHSYVYNWLNAKNIEFVFGADVFSLLLLLAIYIALLIGTIGLLPALRKDKSCLLLSLYFMWCMTGFLLARDMMSFYVFFAAMLVSLLMLVGIGVTIRKTSILYTFFGFGLSGVLMLLSATLIIYHFSHTNIGLPEIALVAMPKQAALVVWLCVCAAFLSRIPIWPLHHWFAVICSAVKNPLVYIVMNLWPLTGIYGFMRFWQLTIPENAFSFLPIVMVFVVITMLFSALIGLGHKEFLPKLFSYSTVYYLLFLSVIVLLDAKYTQNIAYSLFIFIIVNATLTVLELWAENACAQGHCDYGGVWGYMPRLFEILVFFVLVAVGLPISSMFWNNFVLISALFKQHFAAGMGAMFAITITSMGLAYELLMMHKPIKTISPAANIADISDAQTMFFMALIVLLLLSFFNPLWFVF